MFSWIRAGKKRGVAFITENGRYLVVLGLFVVVTFYSLVVVPSVEKKADKEKAAKTEQEISRVQDLDRLAPEKAFSGIFDSQAGDVYRVIVRAEASEAVKLSVSVRAVSGKLLPVASFSAPKGEPIFHEATFLADGAYQDVVVRLEGKDGESAHEWNDARVFVDRVSVTRLSVKSFGEAKLLQPTRYGFPTKRVEYLPAHQDEREDASFGAAKNRIGQYMRSEGTVFSGLHFKAEVVGNGGSGTYVAEIAECVDESCSFKQMIPLDRVSFRARELDRYKSTGEDDIYRIPLSASLDPSKLYFVGIDASLAGANKKDYLLLKSLGGREEIGGSFFGAEFLEKSDILSLASIEDIGKAYRYEYRMTDAESDLADVYESVGKVKWNKSLGGLAMPQDKDASMTFRVNTIYPISAMRISAKGIATKTAQFVMEYSTDGSSWSEIPYVQQESSPQVFDSTIKAEGKTEVFIRARSVQDGSKFQDWGVRDLAISAFLEKR